MWAALSCIHLVEPMHLEGSRNILLQQLQIEFYRGCGPGGSAYSVRVLEDSSATLTDVKSSPTGATGVEPFGLTQPWVLF